MRSYLTWLLGHNKLLLKGSGGSIQVDNTPHYEAAVGFISKRVLGISLPFLSLSLSVESL